MIRFLAFILSSSLLLADTQTQTEIPHKEAPWLLVPQVSVISPRTITLNHGGFSIPYGQHLAGLPAFYLGTSVSLGTLKESYGDFEFFSIAKAGYAFKQAPVAFNDRISNLSLHWVPLSAGIETRFRLESFPLVRPSLTVGGGVHWINQRGEITGINSSFWVPQFFISPALSFFESNSPTDWFGGFSFGMTYQDSFGAQTVRAWSFDLSMSLIL